MDANYERYSKLTPEQKTDYERNALILRQLGYKLLRDYRTGVWKWYDMSDQARQNGGF